MTEADEIAQLKAERDEAQAMREHFEERMMVRCKEVGELRAQLAAQAGELAALKAEKERFVIHEPEHVVLAPDGDLIFAWNTADGSQIAHEFSVDAARVRAALAAGAEGGE